MATILITGTSSGIGLATTVRLAARGEHVFASMRDTSRAGPLVEALRAAGAEATIVQLDVTDPLSVQRAVESVLVQAGSIGVLVNNAGIGAVGPLEESTDADALALFDTNVFGPLRTIRAVLPSMRASGAGRIVNVSSGASHARIGVRLWGLYAASKSALHTLTMELLKEVSPLGIEVVLVEGGVSGQTAVWDGVRRTMSQFHPETSPYGLSQRVAAAQLAAVSVGEDPLSSVAEMLADACTVQNPSIRFPANAQTGLDAADRIPDDVFSRLAKGDVSHELYESSPGFWPLQRLTLSEVESTR